MGDRLRRPIESLVVAVSIVAGSAGLFAADSDRLFLSIAPLETAGPASVMAFDIDEDGLPVPAETYSTGGAARGLSAPQDLVLARDDALLFATNNESSSVTAFGVAAGGTLFTVSGSPFVTGFLPVFLAPHPDRPYLYVNNGGQLGVYEIGANGALAKRQVVQDFTARQHAVKPDGRFLYAADVVAGARGFEISASGTLTELPDSPYVFDTSRPFYIDVASDGAWVYVLDLDKGIATFQAEVDGGLRLIGQTPLDAFAEPIVLSQDDRYLYVGFPHRPEIRGYAIGSDGLPSELPGSPFAAEYAVTDLIAPPGTSRLYQITRDLSSVLVFDIGGGGALTAVAEPVTVSSAGVPLAAAYLRAATLEVEIDVKPGSDRNPIHLRGHGVIPVAILGSGDLDVGDVLWASVRFGPDEAPPAHGSPHPLVDINGDGHLDVILHFRTLATGIACGDTSASLIGSTLDGAELSGTDAIDVVGCGRSRVRGSGTPSRLPGANRRR